jgi:hypothetical protein
MRWEIRFIKKKNLQQDIANQISNINKSVKSSIPKSNYLLPRLILVFRPWYIMALKESRNGLK